MLRLPARRLLSGDFGPEQYAAADDAPVLSREPVRLEVCTRVGLARVCSKRAAVLAVPSGKTSFANEVSIIITGH